MRSRFFEQEVDSTTPSFINGKLKLNVLNDETSYLQYGQSNDEEFFQFELHNPKPSGWNKFPTRENPENRYKFCSMHIVLDDSLTTYNRQTYSSLDFLGDLGGLYDALRYLFKALLIPFITFQREQAIMKSLFSQKKPIETEDENYFHMQLRGERSKRERSRALKTDVVSIEAVKNYRYNPCRKSRKQKKMQTYYKRQMDKELDLQRFIERQRASMSAILCLLSHSQLLFVNKLSKMVLKDDLVQPDDSDSDEYVLERG